MLAVGFIFILTAFLIANVNNSLEENNIWDLVAGALFVSGACCSVISLAIWAWRAMP